MIEKIVKTIVAAELIGIAVLGGWAYSESRYHQGRADAATEIGDKFRELLKDTNEKHETQGEEA